MQGLVQMDAGIECVLHQHERTQKWGPGKVRLRYSSVSGSAASASAGPSSSIQKRVASFSRLHALRHAGGVCSTRPCTACADSHQRKGISTNSQTNTRTWKHSGQT